jgi:hypothetical protein
MKIINNAYRIKIRIADFINIVINEGIRSAITKTLDFLIRKFFLETNKESISLFNQFRIVLIFSSRPDKILTQIKTTNQSPNRVYARYHNKLLMVNPSNVKEEYSYIIFCDGAEYIKQAIEIRSKSWKNKLIISDEALISISVRDHLLYVDHVVGINHNYNGFLGNLRTNFTKFYEFYTALWGDMGSQFGMLTLIKQDNKLLSDIHIDTQLNLIEIKYTKEELQLNSCNTFEEILEKNKIQIVKVSEDIFWQYNYYTQNKINQTTNFLTEALAKGVFIKD